MGVTLDLRLSFSVINELKQSNHLIGCCSACRFLNATNDEDDP
jgi:hypothetical protein